MDLESNQGDPCLPGRWVLR